MVIDKNDQTMRKVLGIIAETDPHLDLCEDIEMYLSGMSSELSSQSIELLEGMSDGISNLIEQLQDEEFME